MKCKDCGLEMTLIDMTEFNNYWYCKKCEQSVKEKVLDV